MENENEIGTIEKNEVEIWGTDILCNAEEKKKQLPMPDRVPNM